MKYRVIVIAGGTIEQAIGRDPHNRLKMTIRRDGRPAVTHYRIAEKYRAHTLLDINLETGRTHQIRVHMAHLGHPVVGDSRYGARPKLASKPLAAFRLALGELNRHVLHAKRLSFAHPFSAQQIVVDSPIPGEIGELLRLANDDLRQAKP